MNMLLLLSLLCVHAAGLFGAGHALLHKRDPRSALGWVAACLFVPVGGVLAYALFGIARADSRAEKLMREASRKMLAGQNLTRAFLPSAPEGTVRHPDLSPAIRHLAVPGKSITGRQLVGGNSIQPLHNGEQAYPLMLEAIAEAKERVYLSSFIFGNDSVGHSFAQALINAAGRGVDVRLLVDGVGSFHPALPGRGLWNSLQQGGVQVAHFLPPTLFPPQFSINLRTHRKVLACDGHRAFTGGMNISSHHLAHTNRRDRVQDVHFQCTGPIAWQLQTAFLMDWSFVTGKLSPPPAAEPPCCIHTGGTALCRVFMDGPGRSYETIHDLFCAMLSTARESVRIMTPYFLPTAELWAALNSAVSRGVQVDIILPAQNNHRLVAWAMHHQLPELALKGVNLFWQPPPFTHTKLMLIDDIYTLMGSANLDPRSLNLNFELVMEIIDPALTDNLSEFFDNVLASSSPMSPDIHPALPIRLRNAACWLFSPYL